MNVAPPRRPAGIRADGVGFRYAGSERPAIRDVTFELGPGELLLLLGPSGSGKSTLARAIAGLVPREFPGEWQGTLRVGDLEVVRAPTAQVAARVGIVFQDPASQLVMERAGDDVAFGLENRAWPTEAMRSRVPAVLAQVGLAGFESRVSSRLSGGEQQRLAIAGVLAPAPGLLVLDEPTANLDPDGCAAVFAQLARLRSQGTSIVLVEHRVELAWPIADRVLALGADGVPIDFGAPSEVLARAGDRLENAGIWLPDGSSIASSASAEGTDRPTDAWGDVVSARGETLRFEAVRFGYGSRDRSRDLALDGVDLAIGAGERVALVGPNGSGKTTILRLGLGLLRPGAGRIELEGHDPARMPPARLARAAGYVVQDPELGFVADSVAEEVTLGLAGPDRDRAIALAAQLDLPFDRFAERSPYRLSGGEQRRLSLVTAFARRPRLLALDEPTYGQDRHGHEALVAALAQLGGEETAMIAATHDERFVRDAATRRVELAAGRIVADTSIRSPSAAPRD